MNHLFSLIYQGWLIPNLLSSFKSDLFLVFLFDHCSLYQMESSFAILQLVLLNLCIYSCVNSGYTWFLWILTVVTWCFLIAAIFVTCILIDHLKVIFIPSATVTFSTETRLFRSSRPYVFCKTGALKNFAKFTGKHLCQSLFFNKVPGLTPLTFLKKRLWHRCFPVSFANFLRIPFLYRTALVVSSGCLKLGHR